MLELQFFHIFNINLTICTASNHIYIVVLYQLQRNANCWPFLEPVTRDIAPDYFDVIEKPMDIQEIRRKTGKKEYTSKQQFIDDFNLIVDNCTKYNGVNSGRWNTWVSVYYQACG